MSDVDFCIKESPQAAVNEGFLDTKMNIRQDLLVFGPNKKSVLLCLPYIGINGDKISRQLSRLLTATVPWVDFRTVFIAKNKLSRLSHLKCSIPTFSKSGVVYCIKCADCEQFYVGMTVRRLSQRIDEHRVDSNSALHGHSILHNHTIDFDSAGILSLIHI